MAKKYLNVPIDENLLENFKKKCKLDNLKYNEAIQALCEAYVNNHVSIKVKTSYVVSKEG